MSNRLSSLLLTAKTIIQKITPYIPAICVIISRGLGNGSHQSDSGILRPVNTENDPAILITISRYSELLAAEEALRGFQEAARRVVTSVPSTPTPGEKDTPSLDNSLINPRLTSADT